MGASWRVQALLCERISGPGGRRAWKGGGAAAHFLITTKNRGNGSKIFSNQNTQKPDPGACQFLFRGFQKPGRGWLFRGLPRRPARRGLQDPFTSLCGAGKWGLEACQKFFQNSKAISQRTAYDKDAFVLLIKMVQIPKRSRSGWLGRLRRRWVGDCVGWPATVRPWQHFACSLVF